MPLDPETGLYREGVYRTPGSALDAALSMFNVQRSEDMRLRRRGAEDVAALAQMTGMGPEVDAFLATPEGQSAIQKLGIAPESIRSIHAAKPDSQLRKAMTANPNMDEEEYVETATRVGALSPERAATAATRFGSQETRRQKQRSDYWSKTFSNLMDPKKGGGYSAQEAAQITAAQYDQLYPEDAGGMAAVVATLPSTASPGTAAALAKTGAETGLLTARTTTEDELRDEKKRALGLRAEAAKIAADASKLRAQKAGQSKSGGGAGLDAKERRATRKELAALQKRRSAIAVNPLTRKYAKDELETIDEQITELRDLLDEEEISEEPDFSNVVTGGTAATAPASGGGAPKAKKVNGVWTIVR